MTQATCRNCDAPLTGPYCAQCGQYARDSARSMGALLHDAWHVATHVDGRFWSTLRLLALRPGQLTLDYFAERRARYVPPVRLYLVVSLVFFGVASLSALLQRTLAAPATAGQPDAAVVGDAPPATGAAPPADAAAAGDEPGLNFDVRDCGKIRAAPRWLEAPLRDACRRNFADQGKSLRHAFVANLPKTMFVFLPLVALVMRVLYWFPHRYYVEHLVFVLHNHAALFLAMTLEILLAALGRGVPPLPSLAGLATFGYALWYLYRSMRRYYGQGRALTVAKLVLVGCAYLLFGGVTLLGNLVVSALTA